MIFLIGKKALENFLVFESEKWEHDISNRKEFDDEFNKI